MNLIVNEIFYSLQGEGGRVGQASIFIRLSKCNLSCSFCDTEFDSGESMSLSEILQVIEKFSAKWIIWTGGEPSLQLRDEHLIFFKELGYNSAIETNGTHTVPALIDYITCSPKVYLHKIKGILPRVNEIRLPIACGDVLPDLDILPIADNYFISPIFNGQDKDIQNIQYCVDLVKSNPRWALSLQMHKLIGIE